MIDLGALKITIETGADKAKTELNDVGDTAEKQQSKFSNFGSAIKKGALIGVGALAGLSAGAVKVVGDMADMAGNLDDMSKRTGTSAEELQKWAYAAKLSGMETETLEKAMIKQQTAFANAKSGNETMAESYKQLGINISEIGSSSEAFDLVIAKLADMEDETQRNALANDIFGKSYAELAPMLSEGSEGINKLKQEAVDLGGVMSNEAVDAGAKFGDSLDSVKTAMNGVFMKVGAQLLPIFDKLVQWILAHMPEIEKVVQIAFKAIEFVAGLVGKAFDAILPILVDLYNWVEPYFPVIQEIIETTFDAIGKTVKILTNIFWGIVDAIKTAIDWLTFWDNKKVDDKNINTNTKNSKNGRANFNSINGSHANGLDYVPFDGYLAQLHRGERVLTAQEAKNYNNNTNTNNIVINATVREDADIEKISRELEKLITKKQRALGTV